MIELLYVIQLILLGAIIFALGMYVGIWSYKSAQSPFIATPDLTPTNDNTSIDDKKVESEGFDYDEYQDYVDKLGHLEGIDE